MGKLHDEDLAASRADRYRRSMGRPLCSKYLYHLLWGAYPHFIRLETTRDVGGMPPHDWWFANFIW